MLNTNKTIKENEIKSREERANYLVPAVNIYETENEYVLTSELPGVNKETLNISLDNKTLIIEGKVEDAYQNLNLEHEEYTVANYYRTFNVGDTVDKEKIEAVIKNGVLTLTLPKAPEIKPRKIEIKS